MQKTLSYRYQLKFNQPARLSSCWESALPIGNGKVGALVQGGVKQERIMICDTRSMWKGCVGVLPDISDKMNVVRKYIDTKNPVMAGNTIENAFISKKYVPAKFSCLPVADLVLNQDVSSKVDGYSRILTMDNEEVSVIYSLKNARIERNMFVSFDDDIVYYEIEKTGETPLNITLSLCAHDKRTSVVDNEYCGDVSSISEATINYLFFEMNVENKVVGAVARVVVNSGASLHAEKDTLEILDAEKVVVMIKTYVGKPNSKLKETTMKELADMHQISYDKAFKQHILKYSKLWGKTELVLNGEKDDCVENILDLSNGSCSIYEKLFYVGKYLLLCGVKDEYTGQYLSGLWDYYYDNKKALADISCSSTPFYEFALMCGLNEKTEGLCNYFIKFQDDLKKVAGRIYKSKGFQIPNYIVCGSALPASIKAEDISNVVSGAVIANLFYDYFLYTKDIKFLRNEAVPFMCDVAEFYMNYFYDNGKGSLSSCPSFSPFGKSKAFENKNIYVYADSYADFMVVRALIQNILSASNNYAISIEKMVEYQNFLNKIPVMVSKNGEFLEYALEDNSVKSSGFMHYYSVFNSKEVTVNGNNLRVAPYVSSIDKKIGNSLFSQNLVSLGRIAQICAILGKSKLMTTTLEYMLKNFLSDNLLFLNSDKTNGFSYSNGDNFFNLAGNMLVSSALVSSMVLDYGNNITIMSAKPDMFKQGSLKGIYTKQNVVVDVDFDDKRGNMLITFKALRLANFNCILFKGVKKVKNYTIDINNPFIENIKLSAGKTLKLEIKY